MYFRVKRSGGYAYLQIVESFREQGHVRQRVLKHGGSAGCSPGRAVNWKTCMRSGLRFCEKLAVIDAHAAGQTEAGAHPAGRSGPGVWPVVGSLAPAPVLFNEPWNRAATGSMWSGPSI